MRDVDNLRDTLGRFAPELLETEYAREMWALFEAGHLKAESRLTGVFAREEGVTDTTNVMDVIEDAREENIRRELGRAGYLAKGVQIGNDLRSLTQPGIST